jgi:hypothetical protein
MLSFFSSQLTEERIQYINVAVRAHGFVEKYGASDSARTYSISHPHLFTMQWHLLYSVRIFIAPNSYILCIDMATNVKLRFISHEQKLVPPLKALTSLVPSRQEE